MARTTERFVLVPVRVDAFIFNAQSYFPLKETNNQLSDPVKEAGKRAILAPITPPDYRKLRLESEFIQHDILGPIDIRQIDLNGTYLAPRLWSSYPPVLARKLENLTREGVYLHWSLPKMYRQGMTTTPSAQAVHKREVLRHGYKDADAAAGNSGDGSSSSSSPVFRPVPDRWVVVRHVEDGAFSRQTLSGEQMTRTPLGSGSGGGSKIFVIESTRVRHIDEIPPDDDLLTSTSAYIDPSKPLDQQGEMFLGCSWSLQEWIRDYAPSQSKYIPLTVVTTGNPFFADYQQHNTGVFSFYDDVTARPGDPEYQENAITTIDRGKISYIVMGFHSAATSDPLVIDPKTTPAPLPSHEERLKMCSMEMNDKISPDDSNWLDGSDGAQMRVLCHGSALSIDWNTMDPNHLPPPSPADAAQELMCASHPIAVGTNSIDALLGWMRVSMGTSTSSSGISFSDVVRSLLKIQTLVQNTEDTVDSQLEAAELMATNNFIRHSGGTEWHLKTHPTSTSSQSQKPDESTLSKLRDINMLQRMLDACLIKSARLKIDLFEEFWKYLVDRDHMTDHDKKNVADKVSKIVDRLGTSGTTSLGYQILDKRNRIEAQRGNEKGKIECEPGVQSPFVMQQDPTVLFAGIPSSADNKASGKPLTVRLDDQETTGLDDLSKNEELEGWARMIDGLPNGKMGDISAGLVGTLKSLLKEAAWLSEHKACSVPPDSSVKSGNWDGQQAWFPLFVEWTAEYYHIPFADWEFNVEGSEGDNRYRIKPGTILSDDTNIKGDFRILSGRSPILQQTSNSIQTLLKQLFSTVNPDELDKILTPEQRAVLLKDVANLPYLSATMDGFTDQLLTRKRGTHLQPNSRPDKGLPEALKAALGEIGLGTDEAIALMDFATPYTPFASLTPIPADPAKYSPFKPCTHGQFRFTKLLVVDKFGQVITPINVCKPNGQNPIYPCPSDTYALEALADGTANAILRYPDHPIPQSSEFVQIPPCLNQPARLNADFVMYDKKQLGWRATNEWDNPICGWIVVNYPDFSIQVFDQEGHFIREFQIMNATAVSYPFEPVETLPGNVNSTLRDLMTMMSKKSTSFLEGLFDTVCAAGESVKHPPNTYAESMMSVLGRPLAVVQMGFSLELANAPLVNQSTFARKDPKPEITSYDIRMKLGDKDNTLDGLVGYFKQNKHDQETFDMSSFYSYFAPSTKIRTGDPSTPIPGPMSLNPYYLDPADPSWNSNEIGFTNAHDAQRQVIAAIIDPFVAVHAYTELLPTALLSLPQWTVMSGIKRVSTFFRMGPLLVPGDVPSSFVSDKAVKRDYQLDEKNVPDTTGTIPVPVALRKDEWVWLQPYYVQPDDDPKNSETEYNFLDVEEAGQVKPWDDGQGTMPCTAVEGYLQMRRPFWVDGRSQPT